MLIKGNELPDEQNKMVTSGLSSTKIVVCIRITFYTKIRENYRKLRKIILGTANWANWTNSNKKQ